MLSIISNTIKGGIFFLFPIVLILIFFEKIIHVLKPLASKISEALGLENSFFDAPYLIAIIIILLFCFLAGTVAKLGAGKWMVSWIEDHLLTLFPGYQLMKNTLQANAGLESDKDFPVVLVPIDGWMIAFLVDTLPNGDLVVFVPSAPNTWEGNVNIFHKEHVKPSNLTQKDATLIMRRLGVGAAELFAAHQNSSKE
ncbi:DUF502 domain-containing protein [Algoriphagus halophytocola]|uniref:DUF502 domain-containing protein n=1 Tax=Algoriphagus halophytocola TaxID=2991499 RepID=A0ABY6MKC3_9BACT|nr:MULTISPECIES: DUF502 domain-containing protein [unclassified Algoriphagus]UZD23414.1 DUF502 domain-containing protein [Algoriphagus sp. TR-M5]WBL44709.1 DUF502 domain-containing protein [Algoriphagus sp. TR-M9]